MQGTVQPLNSAPVHPLPPFPPYDSCPKETYERSPDPEAFTVSPTDRSVSMQGEGYGSHGHGLYKA